MLYRKTLATMAALTLALAGATATAQPAAPVVASGEQVTVGGAAIVALPAGWSKTRSGDVIVCTAPEGDAIVGMAAVTGASNAADAATRAWALIRPAFARGEPKAQAIAADGGYDEIAVVRYDVPPAEKAEVQALAFRKGTTWTVIAVEGAIATLAKRDGQLGAIFGSVRPVGYVKETFAGRTARPLDAARIGGLRAFVADAIEKLRIPGAGLAVIDHGRIAWEGGVGTADPASGMPVNANTRFMVASNTKGMVTLLLASLVDEGKLDWDAPVQRYLPDFRLGDAETSRKVMVRHLVCACTGLPRDDMQWILGTSKDTGPQATFDMLARTQPTSKFGEVYQYSNPLASAAGYLAAHVLYPDMDLGAAFDRAMQERVFGPIGMSRATFSAAETLDNNWARPNSLAFDGTIGAVDPRLNDVIGPYRPAGGLWASTHDVAEYVIEELGAGTMPGRPPIVSSRNALIRRDYGVQTGENVWYGMGLETDGSSGVEVLQHGGSLLGYKTDWYAVPEAGTGIVLLLNSDAVSHALGEIVKRKFLEVLYDGEPQAAKYLADRAKRLSEDTGERRKELAFPVPAADAQALEGTYLNDAIGRLTLSRQDGQLILRTVSHWSQVAERTEADGSRSLIPVSPGALSFPFLVTERDGKRALVLNDNQHEFVFTRAE